MSDSGNIDFVPVTQTDSAVSGSMNDSPPSNQILDAASPVIYASILHGGFPGEPSLFQELGIHSTDIVSNLKIILLPRSHLQTVDDNFLVGLLFFFCFAASLFLIGKARFRMVYTIAFSGFLLLYNLLTHMSPHVLSMGHLFTAISYSTVPLIPAVLVMGMLRLKATSLTFASMPFLFWSAFSATRYVMAQLRLAGIVVLVFVPLFLFYGFLLLLPVY
jgi:hypothetical protein